MDASAAGNNPEKTGMPAPSLSALPVFRVSSAVAVFVRYLLMTGCTIVLGWAVAALGLLAFGSIDGIGWQEWRANPGVSVSADVLVTWAAGLWLLCSTRRRWPEFWDGASAERGFGMTRHVAHRHLLLGALVGIVIAGVDMASARWLFPSHAVEHRLFALAGQSALAPQVALACTAVTIVPLVEEFMFRGVLLAAVLGYGRETMHSPSPARTITAVVLTAALFALIHVPAYGWHVLPLSWIGLGGIAMAWMRLRTRSLWPGVALHATVNLIGSIGLFVTL